MKATLVFKTKNNNSQEVLRREWMFKLVGDDVFLVDSVRCVLRVGFCVFLDFFKIGFQLTDLIEIRLNQHPHFATNTYCTLMASRSKSSKSIKQKRFEYGKLKRMKNRIVLS